MNLTSRLEFISVTRRGALALERTREGGPSLLPLFLPLFLKPVRQFRGCDLRRRRSPDARSNTCRRRTRPYRRHARTIVRRMVGRRKFMFVINVTMRRVCILIRIPFLPRLHEAMNPQVVQRGLDVLLAFQQRLGVPISHGS